MSWSKAAHRSQTFFSSSFSRCARTTFVSTSSVCQKLSLCPRPFMVSTPCSAANSGKIISRSPHWKRSSHPRAGESEAMIFCNSSAMRSPEIIRMRSRLRCSASKVSGSISKLSCVAKRMARIIRRGSSEKVISGSSGVAIMRSSRSQMPSKGSTSSPKRSALRQTARALMVKSRRFWSSSSVPSSTMGLRESWL